MHRRTLLLILAFLIAGAGIVGYLVMQRAAENTQTNSTQRGSGEHRSGIKGSVLLGPACPTQDSLRGSRHTACDDTYYQTKLVVTTSDQAQVIKEFSSNGQGTFTVEVKPGEYAIRSAAAADSKPYCLSGIITVTANNFTETTIYCDTGLR